MIFMSINFKILTIHNGIYFKETTCRTTNKGNKIIIIYGVYTLLTCHMKHAMQHKTGIPMLFAS